jgi:hypothetical protein
MSRDGDPQPVASHPVRPRSDPSTVLAVHVELGHFASGQGDLTPSSGAYVPGRRAHADR